MLRLAKISLLAGGLVAGGVVAASAATGTGPAAATAAGQALSVSTAPLANRGVASAPGTVTPGGNGYGHGGRRGGYGGYGPGGYGGRHGGAGYGRGLTVTSVNGNTIAATGQGGQTVTVQVSATTAYTEAGTTASLSDVKPGSIIAVRRSTTGTGTGTGTGAPATTIDATGVTIVLPRVAGVVTGVNGSTLTLTGFDGTTRTVTVTGSTRYQKAGQSAPLSTIASGTAVVAEGTANGDGSLTAVRVTIQVPRVAGRVTAVSGSSYTVTGRFGQATYTVATTGSTTYTTADGGAASASTVTTNTYIVAEGTLSSDGKTLSAQRIVVAPMGAGRGVGRHGGVGGDGADGATGGANGSAPSGASPSTTGTASI